MGEGPGRPPTWAARGDASRERPRRGGAGGIEVSRKRVPVPLAKANAWTRGKFNDWGLDNVHDEAFDD